LTEWKVVSPDNSHNFMPYLLERLKLDSPDKWNLL